jgi:hypothetical protein
MLLPLTRRQWLRSLCAALTGFWAAGRAPASAAHAAPRRAPAPRPAPAAPGCRWVATYTFDAAGRLVWVEGPWVTASVYEAGAVGEDG